MCIWHSAWQRVGQSKEGDKQLVTMGMMLYFTLLYAVFRKTGGVRIHPQLSGNTLLPKQHPLCGKTPVVYLCMHDVLYSII